MKADRYFEVFISFLKLGCIAFGGPIAHLAFFEQEFVQKRRWLSAEKYADWVALCQFLPGPASSQVGFAIGLTRAGWIGAFIAWFAFTLPSAALMISFAYGLSLQSKISQNTGWIIGLKLSAVAVVAHAIWGMATKLCPDRNRAIIALSSAAFLLLFPNAYNQVFIILMGGTVGIFIYKNSSSPAINPPPPGPTNRLRGTLFLSSFFILLIGLPLLSQNTSDAWLLFIEGFYRAGSLVFGGGHVVLPLLESFAVQENGISRDAFLAGYGATQAMPGPLFSFSAFLGTQFPLNLPIWQLGCIALVTTYLPSWLLIFGAAPFWENLRSNPIAQSALCGTNAAVVGLLIAAFYNPIWTTAILSHKELAFALLLFIALRYLKWSPWIVVFSGAILGAFTL